MSTRVALLKLGSKSVWAQPSVLPEVARQVRELRTKGIRTVIVSSGAVVAGTNFLGPAAGKHGKALLAGVGTLPLFSAWQQAFAEHGLAPVPFLVTHANLADGGESDSVRDNLVACVKSDACIPVVNENDLISSLEIDYWRHGLGENDKLTVALAHLLKDSVELCAAYFGTESGGYFSGNPQTDPSATLIRTLSFAAFDTAKLLPYLNPALAGGKTLNDIYAKIAAAYLCLHIPIPHVAIGPALGLQAFVTDRDAFTGTTLTL